MYKTCLFCNRDMGSNAVLEDLPIGRRVAFDAAKGRLWVICRGCERWNLVPFDARLEAIDACERLFRNTRTRFSTDNIGIARLAEGLELVRIGPAERPEFAAWRYGDQYGSRRKRAVMYGAVGVAAMAGVYYLGNAAGISMGLIPNVVNVLSTLYSKNKVSVRLPEGGALSGAISQQMLKKVHLIPGADQSVGLELQINVGATGRTLIGRNAGQQRSVFLWGREAEGALGRIMPVVNSNGGSRTTVDEAVRIVGTQGTMDILARAYQGRSENKNHRPLHKVNPITRLALEMSAHETSEQEALAGDLKFLERQWRDAERLASIADSIALPETTEEELARLTQRGKADV